MFRRLVASSLFVFLAAPFLLPLGIPNRESNLPACCRRDGKHHCAMMARAFAVQQQQEREAHFRNAPDRCPYRSVLFVRTAPRPVGAPRSIESYAGPASHTAFFGYTVFRTRASQSRHQFKRGPPILS
jgi:hypothetical protein